MSQDISDLVEFEPGTNEFPSPNGGNQLDTSLDDRIAPRRRRWPWLFAGAALGVGATVVATTAGDGDAETAPLLQENVELSVVVVESRDLIEEVEWSGTLAAGSSVAVNAASAGVVTAAVDAGVLIDRGDVIAAVDAEPVVALFGSIPMWRDLADGDVGTDVRQLEANLVHLGFDPDGAVTIDDEYTSATGDMVELWEESLGLEPTGEVPRGRVVILAGPSTVSEGAIVGVSASPNAPLAQLDTLAQTIDVVGWHYDADDEAPGVVTSIGQTGTPVEHGTVLYGVDGFDVVAVVQIDPVAEAVLAAFRSGDAEQIESVLVYLGYDPDGMITIDGEIDLATVAAVQRWQRSAELPATGSTNPRDYVLIPEAADTAYLIDSLHVAVGDVLGEGRLVVSVGVPTLSVAADVAVSEIDEFDLGDAVRVVQLDETEFTAVVAEIADVASSTIAAEQGGQVDEPTVTVTFEITSEPDAFVSGSVTIVTESSRIDDAVVVPTRALVTLVEGGFAVEIRDQDGSTHLVGVELGVFDDGSVEIINGAVAPGDEVVVPS